MKNELKKFLKPSWMLLILFLVILAWESFLLYDKVYGSLETDVPVGQADNVVRLDLSAYRQTLQTLDNNQTFTPKFTNLSNTNPFK